MEEAPEAKGQERGQVKPSRKNVSPSSDFDHPETAGGLLYVLDRFRSSLLCFFIPLPVTCWKTSTVVCFESLWVKIVNDN